MNTFYTLRRGLDMMNTNNSDNRAVIYARFSSHNQRDESIDAQVRACRNMPNKKDFKLSKSMQTGQNQVQVQSVKSFNE